MPPHFSQIWDFWVTRLGSNRQPQKWCGLTFGPKTLQPPLSFLECCHLVRSQEVNREEGKRGPGLPCLAIGVQPVHPDSPDWLGGPSLEVRPAFTPQGAATHVPAEPCWKQSAPGHATTPASWLTSASRLPEAGLQASSCWGNPSPQRSVWLLLVQRCADLDCWEPQSYTWWPDLH